MKMNALYAQIEASKRFNPYKLKDYLIREEGGVIVVDKQRLLKTDDDRRLFYVILNKDYGWDYKNPECITIYLEASNGKIYGGTYDPIQGRVSKRLVAVERTVAGEYDYNLYSYNFEQFSEIIAKLNAQC